MSPTGLFVIGFAVGMFCGCVAAIFMLPLYDLGSWMRALRLARKRQGKCPECGKEL